MGRDSRAVFQWGIWSMCAGRLFCWAKVKMRAVAPPASSATASRASLPTRTLTPSGPIPVVSVAPVSTAVEEANLQLRGRLKALQASLDQVPAASSAIVLGVLTPTPHPNSPGWPSVYSSHSICGAPCGMGARECVALLCLALPNPIGARALDVLERTDPFPCAAIR